MSFESVESWVAQDGEGFAWELFHENSKMSRSERHLTFAYHPSDAVVVQVMRELRRVRSYADHPKVRLPDDLPAARSSFDVVLARRQSARSFGPGDITLAELAKVLLAGTVVTRSNEDTGYPNPFRAAPSGGALYPLEVYVQARRVSGLPPGLFHLDPEDRELDQVRVGDEFEDLAAHFTQPDLASACAAIVFVTAVFYRSIFKYGDRGYRFVLLEAGHVVQNACLAAAAIDLAATPIAGYADRPVDRWLRLDGLSQSTVYAFLIGRASNNE
jgi:SagB-type dehydrogenase family enzyme